MSANIIELSFPDEYEYMQEPLKILGTKDETDWVEFIEPSDKHKVTLVHLGAYSGNRRMLERVVQLGADLNAEDKFKRSALHHAAFRGHVDIVTWLLDESNDCRDQLMLRNFSGDTPLHAAIKGLRCDASRTSPDSKSRSVAIVDLLVRKGAKVNAMNDDRHSPLYLVGDILIRADGGPDAVIWYEKVVKILMSASASANTRPNSREWTPLHQAVCLGSSEATRLLIQHNALVMATDYSGVTPLHLAAGSQYHEIFCDLLKNTDCSLINDEMLQDRNGKTLLHYAAETGHLRNFRTLIDHGASLLTKSHDGMTVLHVLFRHCVDPVAYLTDALDSRVDYVDGGMQEVTLDFRMLIPRDGPQIEVLSTLISAAANKEDMTILQHPLLETFLRLKWSKFRYFFLILFSVHVCFLLFLFWYAVALLQKDMDSSLPRRLLLPCAFVLLCHNVLQLLTSSKFNCERHGMQLYSLYLFAHGYCARHFEYWLSIICESTSIFIVIVGEYDTEPIIPASPDHPDTSYHSWQPESWLLNTVSIVIFFAGIQMMFVIGRFPTLGCYTLMFYTVLKNVVKVFVAFIWFIVSFAFSFFIIFRGKQHFNDWWVAIVKTVAMMTGEYEYGRFLTATSEDNSTDNNLNSLNTVLLPPLSGIVFLLFVMFANVVLMNIITALAVTDVKGLVKTGKLLRLMKQAELLAYFELTTTRWILSSDWAPNCLKEILKIKIADKSSIWRTMFVKRQWYRHGCISDKLIRKLIDLGQKNMESQKTSEMGLPRQEPQGDLTQIIFNLKEQIRELERRNIMHSQQMRYGHLRDGSSKGNATALVFSDHKVDEKDPIPKAGPHDTSEQSV